MLNNTFQYSNNLKTAQDCLKTVQGSPSWSGSTFQRLAGGTDSGKRSAKLLGVPRASRPLA